MLRPRSLGFSGGRSSGNGMFLRPRRLPLAMRAPRLRVERVAGISFSIGQIAARSILPGRCDAARVLRSAVALPLGGKMALVPPLMKSPGARADGPADRARAGRALSREKAIEFPPRLRETAELGALSPLA